ncbi:MAG TPA: hypothetical protein VHO92_04220, partial [Methanobacterium sp.]|nr:hypothetical protein [Methanobacterium sp.]
TDSCTVNKTIKHNQKTNFMLRNLFPFIAVPLFVHLLSTSTLFQNPFVTVVILTLTASLTEYKYFRT